MNESYMDLGFEATAYLQRAQTAHDPEAADRAVRLFQQALAVLPAEHCDDWLIRGDLASALHVRSMCGTNPDDSVAAIATLKEALALAPDAHPHLTKLRSHLFRMLEDRYHLTGDPLDRDELIDAAQVMIATSADVPVVALSNISRLYLFRYSDRGADADLATAVDLARRAHESMTPGHPQAALVTSNVAEVLLVRFQRFESPADARIAIELLSGVLPGSVGQVRGRLLRIIGAVHLARFERTGQRSGDLEAAIVHYRAAVEMTDDSANGLAESQAGLGSALQERSRQSGDSHGLADLNEAIELSKRALELSDGHQKYLQFAHNLGFQLRIRFLTTHNTHDIEAAIEIFTRLLEEFPPGHPARPSCLDHLNQAKMSRRRYLDDAPGLNSIEKSRELYEALLQAMDTLPDGDPDVEEDKQRYRDALAQLDLMDDSGSEVDLTREAADATPPGRPQRGLLLMRYADALRSRSERTGHVADLEEAITVGQEAFTCAPVGNRHFARIRLGLADSFEQRFDSGANPEDLDTAIAYAAAAADGSTGEDRAVSLYRLSSLYYRRAQPDDHGWVLAALREAASTATARPGLRLTAASDWAQIAAERPGTAQEALEGYSLAVTELLPRVAWRGLGRTVQELELSQHHGLASRAAAQAIKLKENDLALELLEAGRNVLWSHKLDARGGAARLRDQHPGPAAQLENAGDQLNQPNLAEEDRVAAAIEWDQLIDQIRALDGFAEFMRPPSASALRSAAAQGPVVVVNVADDRCDALIVNPDSIDAVELKTTHVEVARYADTYLSTLRSFEDMPEGMLSESDYVELDQTMARTLQWMWDAVTEPVLARLGYGGPLPGGWPRLWWCPTGPFTILPLHAAGDHLSGCGRTVLDRVISSYTPTLRALIEARRVGTPPIAVQRMLIVATPQADPPLKVEPELRLLTAIFNDRCTVLAAPLAGDVPSRASVGQELVHHAWVHFACHGSQSPTLTEPTKGCLHLHGEDTVTVGDLVARRLPYAEFTFLSACQTATGGVGLADESIHLAAALQYAGTRHVIGTLWSIHDSAAPIAAEQFYPRLFSHGQFDPADAAEALHHVIRELRRNHEFDPSRWAPFIHLGP